MDRPYLFGSNTAWRARIAAVLEDRDQAVALLRQAYREGQSFGLYLFWEPDLQSLQDYPHFQQFLKQKGGGIS